MNLGEGDRSKASVWLIYKVSVAAYSYTDGDSFRNANESYSEPVSKEANIVLDVQHKKNRILIAPLTFHFIANIFGCCP